jgi:hypothetical protein
MNVDNLSSPNKFNRNRVLSIEEFRCNEKFSLRWKRF